jgi:aspartate/methionine/tyrosine aminotransferase
MELLARHGAWLVADVVYAKLPMDWKSIPVPGLAEPDADHQPDAGRAPDEDVALASPRDLEVAVVSSAAKAWCAPGLRVGWLATSSLAWRERSVSVHSLFNTHASSLAQQAVLWLLEHLDTRAVAATLRRRGEAALAILRPSLPALSLPPGSFYLWIRLPEGVDDVAFAKEVAAATDGVALVPGSAFGDRGKGHLRLSFGVPIDRVEEGCRRFLRYLARIGSRAGHAL